ncbi:SDR family NAD(P)-dependent oxidoreductase [Novosphingobium bradum]|uniref:SDR family NAD(P)-dependent oxidoreductase n=1 Tax=Novosphingobium bradum TaxID=1737444 RepID=A0ABV7IPY5_9SPHN
MPELRFDGAVIAITGAGRGMGQAYARLLGARGARVIANDIAGAAETVALVAAAGGSAVEDRGDMADPAATEALVAGALERWGRLDAVVCNAGVYGDSLPDAEETARLLGVHLVATLNLVRSALPVFRAQGHGRIVNVGSGSMFGLPGTAVYAAGKGGVFAFTRAIAADLRRDPACDIKANLILPAAFPPGRLVVPDAQLQRGIEAFTPENIAPLVALLAHPLCPAQGEAIQVGGGRHARIVLATSEGWQAPGDETSPEAILAHWDEVMAGADLREPAGSLADLMVRRGLPDYSVMELAEWTRTGRDPRARRLAGD